MSDTTADGKGMKRAELVRAGRRIRALWPVLAAGVSMAVLVSGCSVLGLSQDAPSDVSIVTSAAPVASTTGTARSAVTIPTLQTGSATSAPTPTPWASLTSSAPPSTSEAPLTAPTTTHTLTFSSFSSATKPTIAAPSLAATPPPACYGNGSCRALGSASVAGGTLLVVNPPGGSNSVAILTVSGKAADSLSLARLSSPSVACSGSYCLVQGGNSGLAFGSLVAVAGGRLRAVPGSPVSAGRLRMSVSGSSVLVAGTQRFDGYGLPPADSPVAVRTWALSGGSLVSTGCGAPRLYSNPPGVSSPQRGSCTGTPQVAGYGSASAHPMVSLGGFVTSSGNIACAVISGPKLACTAKSYSFWVPRCTLPVRTVPAGLRGLRVLLGTSGGMYRDGCLGYTLIGSPATRIGYNRMAVGYGFVCEVQESGIRCTARSGHGFTLSRSSLRSY